MSDMMIKNSLVKVKEHPPYLGDMEGKVLLNSLARATLDPKTGEYSFKGKLNNAVPLDTSNVTTLSNMATAGGLADPSGDSFSGIGVDQGWFNPSQLLAIHTDR
jgi:fatty acid synthase subunit alpha